MNLTFTRSERAWSWRGHTDSGLELFSVHPSSKRDDASVALRIELPGKLDDFRLRKAHGAQRVFLPHLIVVPIAWIFFHGRKMPIESRAVTTVVPGFCGVQRVLAAAPGCQSWSRQRMAISRVIARPNRL